MMPKINDLKQIKTANAHQRSMQRMKERTRRQEIRSERKQATQVQSGKTKRTLTRSGTIAALGAQTAETQQAKAKAQRDVEIARINALITGNTSGVNEVDPTKDGEKASGSGQNSTTNYFEGW